MVRFHGGSDVVSRLRSSHAASCAESHDTASIRRTRATIGVRWPRSRKSSQYEATRRRSTVARPM
jgi:hypothetical protein